jgi:uncharacterized protein (TIGR03437 family)
MTAPTSASFLQMFRYPATWVIGLIMASLPFLGGPFGCVNSLSAPGYVEENRGQAPAEFAYYSKRALFSNEGLVVSTPKGDRKIAVRLAGAQKSKAQGEVRLATRVNYFVGQDQSKWITDIPTFGRVRYREVYPGIAALYYPSESFLEQDFEVAPGADPSVIRMRFDGADGVHVNSEGAIEIAAGGERIEWKAPVVYQEDRGSRHTVRAKYRPTSDGSIGFEVGEYDRSRKLVIDPVITFSTYIGRSASDIAGRTAVDSQGNVYVAGATFDPSFPVVAGTTPAPSDAGTGNAVMVKMNASGTQALTVTHFGGSNPDMAHAVALDAAGNIYLAGYTESPDFPTTASALRTTTTAADKISCFVTKFNPAANRILYSTYLGGSSRDQCFAIAVDPAGAVYAAGVTESRDFPATPDTFQPNFRASSSTPGFDGFITKLNPTGTALVYSTFLGGAGHEYLMGLAVDAEGNAYVTGSTTSTNFPVTQGALQSTYGGASPILEEIPTLFLFDMIYGDAFVAKINKDASALVYSTYLGGRQDDVGYDIAVDSKGNAYVVGMTRSTDFLTTPGTLQTVFKGSGGETVRKAGDGFVTKLDPSGKTAVYSTYLGGSQDDRTTAIAVDAAGNAWVTGHTVSTDFPTTSDARQKTNGGFAPSETLVLGDAYITQLDATGSKILYSTYHGGSGNDAGYDITVAADGGVIVSGATGSKNLFTTPGVFQTAGGTGDPQFAPFNDFFLVRVGEPPAAPKVSISSVVHEASGAGGAVVSPGLIVAINGENLSANSATAEPVDGWLPDAVGETRVWFGETAARLISISPARIVAIVPYGVAGSGSVKVSVEASKGLKSEAVTLAVVAATPGVYSLDGSGSGQVLAVNEDGSANDAEHPAVPGSMVKITIGGAGQTDPQGEDGRIVTSDWMPLPMSGVVAAIGDQGAEVVEVHSVEGQPLGRFAVMLRIPADAPGAGAYPVRVKVGESEWSQEGVVIQVGNAPAGPMEGLAPAGRRRR